MFFREPGGKLSAYIGLQLLATGRKLFYSHSSNPFHDNEMKSIEEEALIFVEGLGAFLDEKDFTQRTSQDKKQWMEEQEIFSEKAEPESTEEAPAEGAQAAEAHAVEAPQGLPSVQQEPLAFQPSPVSSTPAAAPQPPQQPEQYVPQTPSVPIAPQAAPSQAQPVAYEQPTLETQKEQPAPIHENHASLPKKAKQVADRTAEEEIPEKPIRSSSEKGKQEIMQKAIKAGIVKAPKPSLQREARAASGVVSRDREALARLLTSF